MLVLSQNGDHLLPPDEDDCVENEEEEYDALNDETFGGLEDSSVLDDWEQQHEQYAEIAESNKHSEQLENSISLLMLDDTDNDPLNLAKNSVWSYTPPNKNGDIFNSSILSSLQKASKSFIETHSDSNRTNELHKGFTQSTPLPSIPLSPIHHVPKQIRTVEELEKNLIKSSKQHQPPLKPLVPPSGHHQGPPFPHPLFQHPLPPSRLPPGLPPIGIPPPVRHMPMPHHPHLPPGLVHMLPPHFMHQGGPPRHPGLIYPPGNAQFPVNHPYNFPPPPRNVLPQNSNHLSRNNVQQQQRTRNDSYKHKSEPNQTESKDEYAGLMTSREKQWLLNIQMLQLNTGTPYFDDYYYTVFKERKAKSNKENFPNERNHRYQNNRQQRNNERQDNNNTLTPRVYTPLQFENSLGKLQCGSVTAPRKIIDMDIVTPDKDSDNPVVVRDTRKTKQLLLELEALFTLLLKAEDLRNPLAISNMDKLREIKQKQRLRELDLAPTPEQKQEVLKLLKQDSEPVVENQHDYIVRIVGGLLQEEKFASFLNIRKGKMLLLRLLPHLSMDSFSTQLLEIWTRILLSIPTVGRRDTAGDHILPKLHPFFKRYIQTSTMGDILDIVAGLVEVIRQENSRSTPLSHQGKAPLYFVLLNKFGVSALVTMFIRTEYLISSETATEKQQHDWSNFLVSWAELTGVVNKVATPIEPIPIQIFNKHSNRFENLTPEKKSLLEKHVVDSN
ncbi:PAT1 -like 1 [Asbolus verrucosus]|uniref:PAT1-like 1 n=1 Tax=Asbolus verrucosus TaxID=1661398 RepID=A0A482VPG1_ASBVE|nr:PAT1 -like 1 [Asbolus verrucosus]